MNTSRPENLLSSLRRHISRLEFGFHSFEIESVEDIDRLIESITEKDFQESDEIFPYWAQLWPSAIGLARFLLRERPFSGGRALDLGCGLGLTTLAAHSLTNKVVAFDYCLDALHFCRGNLERNNATAGLLRMHWSQPALRSGFDAIVGSDILYEQRAVKPVTDLIERLLAPNGTAFISTPNRPAVKSFIGEMEGCGFNCQSQDLTVGDQGSKVEIRILAFQRKEVRQDHRISRRSPG